MDEVLTFVVFPPWLVVGKKNVVDSTDKIIVIDKPLAVRNMVQPDGSTHVYLAHLPGYPERVEIKEKLSPGEWYSTDRRFINLYIKRTTNLSMPEGPEDSGGGKVIRI